MNNYDMKIYKQGTVVVNMQGDYGHIVGFDRAFVNDGYVIYIKVLWDDGVVRSTHTANIRVLT